MKNMKRWSALAAALILAGVIVFSGGHQTPPGQAALADLDATTLTGLKQAFNQSQAQVRVLLLLSPT